MMRRGGEGVEQPGLRRKQRQSLAGGEPTVIDVYGRVVATLSSQSVRLRDVATAWQAIVAWEDHRFSNTAG